MAWVIASSLRASGRRGAYPAFFFFDLGGVVSAWGLCGHGVGLVWCVGCYAAGTLRPVPVVACWEPCL